MLVMSNTSLKTVRISDGLHERLSKHGQFGESFEDVIKRILDVYESKTKK
jgi:predicted CopG family antitoxin